MAITTTTQEATMPTTTITPAMRFAAHDWLLSARRTRGYLNPQVNRLMQAVRAATYAESFPTGYTDEVVEAAQALLAGFADHQGRSREQFAAQVDAMHLALAAGRYGKGLR